MVNRRILALGCHPDDIEFMMAGTLFLLKAVGCELHYMNIANGSCGTTELSIDDIVRIRRAESENAALLLGATYHVSLVSDLEVFYHRDLIRRVTAILREIDPDILLLPAIIDYMEDHMNTARIGVTAAFCRGMPNFPTDPDMPPVYRDIAVYHAMPYGLRDGLGRIIRPSFTVDIGSVIGRKEEMLSCHESQKKWLDESQGIRSYINIMIDMAKQVGEMSRSQKYAEGWQKHYHLGYSTEKVSYLEDLLRKDIRNLD